MKRSSLFSMVVNFKSGNKQNLLKKLNCDFDKP